MVCKSKSPHSQQLAEAIQQQGISIVNEIAMAETQLKGNITSAVFKFFLALIQLRSETNNEALFTLEEGCVYFIEQFVKVFVFYENFLNILLDVFWRQKELNRRYNFYSNCS